MAILRFAYAKIVLAVACVAVFLLTSKHLSEWSLRTSLDIASLRRPYELAHANSSHSIDSQPPTPSGYNVCNAYPDTSNILVVVKTGATESYAKIPTQLVTVLKCKSDFLIFSDMEQNIAGYHVYDSLDTVIPEVKKGNRDFDLYHRQQACIMDQQSCNDNGKPGQAFEGWILDKYKNVHIAEKTYQLRPNYDWYLFIDADTYVLWNNLVRWLSKLPDPAKTMHYLGSMSLLNDFRFAHGGSGYILSQATMREFVGNQSGIANQYDMTAKKSCCGDYVLAVALNETIEVGVQSSWPTINGEKPYTIPYGPREWCHPLEFEKGFYETLGIAQTVLRFKDIYHKFVAPKLITRRDDWDNLSEDVVYLDPHHGERFPPWQRKKDRTMKLMQQIHVLAVELDAYKSFDHCRKLCESLGHCFQFSYHAGACVYNKSFKFGKPAMKANKDENKMISGWNVKRIEAWVKRQGRCSEPVWPQTHAW
ncbi:glycosyltransferase family 31 protein [Jackrogersella minutella]|nr:glycosyltransferase family 31 protein [Jackrogersella minutella]